MRRWLPLLLFCGSLFAQSPNVTLTGTLQGPNGLALANNIISLTPTQSFFVAGSGGSAVCNSYIVQINGTGLTCGDTINFNSTTPVAPANGLNVTFAKSTASGTDSVSAAVVGDGNVAHCFLGTGIFSSCPNQFPTAQVGDVYRFNVNGDGLPDAVNYAARQVFIYYDFGPGSLAEVGSTNSPNIPAGTTTSLVNPTLSDSGAVTYTSSSSASTSTVIGVRGGGGANYADYGIGSFYRWSLRFAAGNTTNSRYWMGLSVYFNGGTGNNGLDTNGSTALATDTPNKSTIGFTESDTVASNHWQAAAVTATSGGGTMTEVDTGVAIDTNPHLFEMTTTGTVVVYFIDHQKVATISTNVPSGTLGGNSMAYIFWTGDNKNTANSVSGTHYWMSLSPK